MSSVFSTKHIPLSSIPPKEQVDCTFVGATFATMTTAILLADAGFSVQILEAKSGLGFGDSGKTLLPASLSFTDNLFRLHASLGEEKCRSILDVMQIGITYLQKNGLLRGDAACEIPMNKTEQKELQDSQKIAQNLGFPMKIVSQEHLQRMGENFNFAICHPNQGYVEPHEVYQHLYDLLRKRNITLCPNISVHSFDQKEGKVVLHYSKGTSICDFLFLGAGIGNRDLDVFFREKLTPVRIQMMSIPHQKTHLSAMCETQYGYIQFRDSIQNEQCYRLLTGCRWATPHLEIGEETEDVVDAISQAQWRYAQKHFPFSKELNIQNIQKWSAIQTHSCDGLPIVGPLPGREHIFSLCAFRDRQASLGIGSAIVLAHNLLDIKESFYSTSTITRIPPILHPRRFVS